MRNNKYSDYKIFSFPEKLKLFEELAIAPPLYVRIKPTDRCNNGCYWRACLIVLGYVYEV